MTNDKPCKRVSSDDQSSFLFSCLPKYVVVNCLARVPRGYYTSLSCVSKSFHSLVHSPELAHMRSLLGITYPAFCIFFTEPTCTEMKVHWLTFDPIRKKTSVLNSVPVVPRRQMLCCSVVSIGSLIYFIGGSAVDTSRRVRIFDPWSGELCKGPTLKLARVLPGVVVVDGKIYVMGGCRKNKIKVEVFDPKSQTWEVRRPLSLQLGQGIMEYAIDVAEAVAVEGKIYGMRYKSESHIIYDTKDGTCETFEMASDQDIWRGGVCVIDNVIYVYYTKLGLTWYDSKDKVMRVLELVFNK